MENSIAVITGGNRGLGKNGALGLAARGVGIILTYRSHAEEAGAVVREIRDLGVNAVALPLDVGVTAQFELFAEQLRQVLQEVWQRQDFDILINNAGHGHYQLFTETREEDFDALVNVHLKGPYFLTQKLLPLLRDGGRILNISSGLTRVTFPGSATYAAVKGAMEVLTRYQAKELGERRIRVNVLAPGAVETDFGGGRTRDNQQVNAAIASQTALGRVGLPDDIGDAIAMVLSDESHWINAQRIEVSGGLAL